MEERGRNGGRGSASLIREVAQTIRRHRMVSEGACVLVGVSGGVDSVCLLDLLWTLREELRIRIVVAHLHHGLRGEEADEDFRFVKRLAERYGLPFEGRRVAEGSYRRKGNVQAQARELRYRFYDEAAGKWGASKIATGHHRDDQVETLLMQLFRGAGALRGIAPVREGRYIRPLIDVSREALEAYARWKGLGFREDASNRTGAYLRNRIRLELVPWIRRNVSAGFAGPLVKLAAVSREEGEFLDGLADAWLREKGRGVPGSAGGLALRREDLRALPGALLGRVLRRGHRSMSEGGEGLSFGHVETLRRLLRVSERGGGERTVCLPGGVRAFVEVDALRFSVGDLWRDVPYRYPLPGGATVEIPEAEMRIRALSGREGTEVGGGGGGVGWPGWTRPDAGGRWRSAIAGRGIGSVRSVSGGRRS